MITLKDMIDDTVQGKYGVTSDYALKHFTAPEMFDLMEEVADLWVAKYVLEIGKNN